jgi:dipeptidyl aminopeptidase/acylaminoacyl peptidase
MTTLRSWRPPAAFVTLAGAVFLVSTTALVAAGATDPPARQWTVEAVVDAVAVGHVTLSPDGASVLFTRSWWRADDAEPGPAHANLWRVPATGGEPQRLTYAEARDTRPRFSPDGSTIAFLSKRGDQAKGARVYLLGTAGGEARPITEEGLGVTDLAWSPDGRKIAFVAQEPKSTEREEAEKKGWDEIVVDQNLRPRRLWVVDVATGDTTRLASAGEESVWGFDWSPDGSALVAAVTERNRTDDSYMFKRIRVLPLEGAGRDLVPVVGKVGEVAWSPDGKTVAWLGGVDGSDPYPGSLFVVPAAGGQPENLTGPREETGRSLAWLPRGRIALTSVTGTRSGIWSVDPSTGDREVVVPPGVAAFTTVSWARDGSGYAFEGSTSNVLPDVWVGVPGGTPQQITESNPDLDDRPRGAQETVRYTAGDGLEVEGVVIRPVGFEEGVRYPLVVIVHGGPEAQFLEAWINSYSRPGQALAERGFVVFLPNYRGSTGRGVAYSKADHRDLGGREFLDVLDGIDHLAEKGWVDPERVGMMGGSYGGYFTALAVTRYSERFAAGVNLFGITNWESFLGQSDIPVENAMVHWDLWCYENVDLCREASPVAHIDRADTPTLILQGAKDLRVPKPQSDELYAALRWKKVPVEYVVYPREPHGFRERAHRVDALTRILGWMERHLGSGDGG